jgi:hypothetical protein
MIANTAKTKSVSMQIVRWSQSIVLCRMTLMYADGKKGVKMMNDKPMIKHCRNCKWLSEMGYCQVKYTYKFVECQRISALLCKYYTERELEKWEL